MSKKEKASKFTDSEKEHRDWIVEALMKKRGFTSKENALKLANSIQNKYGNVHPVGSHRPRKGRRRKKVSTT